MVARVSVNYLIIENLERLDYFYGEELKVECPTGSGVRMRLGEVAQNLERRLSNLFLPDAQGRRPCHGPYRLSTRMYMYCVAFTFNSSNFPNTDNSLYLL